METVDFTSDSRFKVTKVLKKSNARYAKGIALGDVITLKMRLTDTTGASGAGRYSMYLEVYSNGDYVGEASQVEILRLFMLGEDSIFEVVEV